MLLRILLVSAAALGCLTDVAVRRAASQDRAGSEMTNREYPLKAVFLYNFGGYIDWPSETFADEKAPFVIGVLGPAPLDDTLRKIAATKTIRGRPIEVRQFDAAKNVTGCHILFIDDSVSPAEFQAAIAATRKDHVFVVTERPGAAQQGASANFYIEQNKLRFEINTREARERNLEISSKMLSLAKVIE